MQCKTRLTLALPILALALGCPAPPAPETETVTPEPEAPATPETEYSTPESVLHDPGADIYLVSQINGNPLEADGNGFISRVSPDGEIEELRWIDGQAEGIELHAPKGMALAGEYLYVTDIDTVRIFDRGSGEPMGEVEVEGATFLNDLVAAPAGGVYLTDSGLKDGEAGLEPSGTAAIYHIDEESNLTTVLKDPALEAPNGIAVDGERILVVTFTGNRLYAIEGGRATVLAELPTGGLDGIVRLPDGRWAIASWEGQAVYAGPLEGPYEKLVEGTESPADIAVDTVRGVLLIPLFNGHDMVIHPLE